ncbi:MAG: hypothetical protein H6R13_1066 [Proteobacteria bacterium]|nr:hypothetical protein [Pseudomonadota bacterium]
MLNPTPLIPQEVYLLERYGSLEYFGQMRDAFEACVKAAEDALTEFMKHLPPDYRDQPLWKQPDAVWGETVIPNLQWALRGLNDGLIVLSHGKADALGMAGNINTSFAAIGRDYTSEWMPEPYQSAYRSHKSLAWDMASNISHTQQSNWEMGELTFLYHVGARGPLNAPHSWPVYRLNQAVRVKTGDKVPQNGVYLPDAPGSCAEFLIEGYEAWEANVMDHPENPEDRSSTSQATVWTLIKRVADSGGGTGSVPQGSTGGETRRPNVPAGTSCPESGWWFTPAQSGSRHYFKAGENMPSVGGDYGLTFWQWSPDQSALSL